MRSESGQSLLGRGGRKRQIPGRGSLVVEGEPKNGGGWKMIFLFNGVIFRFHVNFQGCRHISDVWIYDAVLLCKTRWWQLKYSSFSPLLWGRFPFWLLFFQRGWFNHQLEEYLCMIMQIFVCRPAVICPTNGGLDLLKLLGFYMFNIVLCRLEGKPLQVVYRGLFWWKCCAFECLGVVSLFVCVCVCCCCCSSCCLWCFCCWWWQIMFAHFQKDRFTPFPTEGIKQVFCQRASSETSY